MKPKKGNTMNDKATYEKPEVKDLELSSYGPLLAGVDTPELSCS